MQTLTCPIPSNINPLQSNGFLFSINKLPEISFFCQEANLPNLELPIAVQASPLVDIQHPGDKLTFGQLNITFLVDGGMVNYKVVSDWMMALGFPKSHQQFANWVNEYKKFPTDGNGAATVSDGVLQILNSSNTAIKSIMFKDMFPTSLASLQLQTTSGETTYLAGNASFAYTLYEID